MKKKIPQNPYKDVLKMYDVIGSCFDITPFIQDLNSLSEDELKEAKKYLKWEMDNFGDKWDWYEYGPILYVYSAIKVND